MLSRKLPTILTCVLVAVLSIPAFFATAEAKGKKGKSAVSRSKGKSGRQAKASSRSSRRVLAKRGKRTRLSRRQSAENYAPVTNPSVVPDRIEVLEHGTANSPDLSRWLNPPSPNNQSAGDSGTITPSRKVNIDSMRVIQIQQALASRGFYSGETTGVYDAATIDAMRRFQASNKIAATGYPTAHSLKRLGLASW